MPLIPFNLPRIVAELKQIIGALDVLGGLVKHEPPSERCPYPLSYAPEVYECPTNPETFRRFMFERSWQRLTSSIVHLQHALNNGQVDSLDCDSLTRRRLAFTWGEISKIPTAKPAFLPIDQPQELEAIACNVGALLRQCLANLTGQPVAGWLEGDVWEPEVLSHAAAGEQAPDGPGSTAVQEAAYRVGDQRYQVGDQPPIMLEESEDHVLRSLIDLGGAATKGQLEQQTGKSDGPRILKMVRDKHEALAPYIIMPGRRGRGGYRTTIRHAE